MSDERILEIIENKDKYYILGFIKGIKANVEELRQENQQLKNQINCLQKELNDENLQCSKYVIDIHQLRDNWNELKKIIKQDITQLEQLTEECPRELKNTMVGTRSYETIIEYNKYILSKMQELEKGKSE